MYSEITTDPASLFSMTCPTCGEAVRPRDHFCPKCGHTLGGVQAVVLGPQAAPEPQRSAASVPSTPISYSASALQPAPIASSAAQAIGTKRRKKLWIIPVCFFLFGALLGFLAAAEETSYETDAAASGPADSTVSETAGSESIDQSADAGPGPVSDANPLVRLPNTPDTDVRNPCPAADAAYLESALSQTGESGGAIPMAMLPTERLPYLFSVAFRPDGVIDSLMAVIVVEFSDGKTVATSAVPVYYRKSVSAAEFCACTFDVSTLDYRFQLGMGGTIPVSNDGANVVRMINEGKTSLQLFSGSRLVGALVLSDHTEAY